MNAGLHSNSKMPEDSKKHIAHYELMRLIGELDAIQATDDGFIILHIKGQKIEVMDANATDMVFRSDIAKKLEKQLK